MSKTVLNKALSMISIRLIDKFTSDDIGLIEHNFYVPVILKGGRNS